MNELGFGIKTLATLFCALTTTLAGGLVIVAPPVVSLSAPAITCDIIYCFVITFLLASGDLLILFINLFCLLAFGYVSIIAYLA